MAAVRFCIALVALLGLFDRAAVGQSPTAAPLNGRPTNFSHLVGQFTMTASAEPTMVTVEDAIRLRVSIVGVAADGVHPTRTQLRIFPEGFAAEFYFEPLPESDLSRIDVSPTNDSMAVSGQWDFVWRLRPKSTSVREIPSLALAYYSPALRRFQTARSDAIEIVVTPRHRSIARAELPSDLPASFLELSGWRPGAPPDARHGIWGRVGFREFAVLSGVSIAISAGLWGLRKRHDFARLVAEPAAIGEIRRRPEAARAIVDDYWRTALGASMAAPTAEQISRRLKRLRGTRSLQRDWILWLERADATQFSPGRESSPKSIQSIAKEAIDLIVRTNAAITMTNGTGAARAFAAMSLLTMTAIAVANEKAPISEAWSSGQSAFTDAAGKLLRQEPDGGGMERAARFFREALRAGHASAAGYRDLGNALFLSGDLPGAIAAFCRGLTLDPHDRRLAGHLEFARRQVAVPGGLARQSSLWITSEIPRVFGGLGVIVGVLGCVALPLGVWRRSRPAAIAGAVAIALGVIASVVSDRALDSAPMREQFAVLIEDVPLRTGNGERYESVADLPTLPRGYEVVVLGERGGWLHVQLPSGHFGWVPESKSIREL